MRTIKVSKSLLQDPDIAECFKDEIGRQIYLQIGTTHLRSQFFNSSILTIVKILRKRKDLDIMSAETLSEIFLNHGGADGAVRHPWNVASGGIGNSEAIPGSCVNWRSWNIRLRKERELVANGAQNRLDRLSLLLESITCPYAEWKIEWTEDAEKGSRKGGAQ